MPSDKNITKQVNKSVKKKILNLKRGDPLKTIILIIACLFFIFLSIRVFLWYGKQSFPSPSLIPSETPSTSLDETASWEVYTSDKYNFQIKLPENVVISCDGEDSVICYVRYKDTKGTPVYETLALHFYDNQRFKDYTVYEKLLALKVDETVQLCEAPTPVESCVYKRVTDFNGLNEFVVFENYNAWEIPTGSTYTKMITKRTDRYLVAGFYYDDKALTNGKFSKDVFYKILSTLRFYE